MKDATGELSMTAVAVVAIAAIGVLFSTLVWPTIKQQILRSTYCSGASQCVSNGDGTQTCQYCPNDQGADFSATCDDWQEITCSENSN